MKIFLSNKIEKIYFCWVHNLFFRFNSIHDSLSFIRKGKHEFWIERILGHFLWPSEIIFLFKVIFFYYKLLILAIFFYYKLTCSCHVSWISISDGHHTCDGSQWIFLFIQKKKREGCDDNIHIYFTSMIAVKTIIKIKILNLYFYKSYKFCFKFDKHTLWMTN